MKAKIKKLQWLAVIIVVSMFLTNGCDKSEYECEIYENRDIPTCGVNDPLQNIEWLREYCENVKEKKDIFISVFINLFKLRDQDEFFFQISVYSESDKNMCFLEYRDCSGDIVHVRKNGKDRSVHHVSRPPDPWLDDKELVAELFHFYLVKQ